MQVREACTAALKESIRMANGADNMSHAVDAKTKLVVTSSHFEIALTRVFPSVSNTVSILFHLFFTLPVCYLRENAFFWSFGLSRRKFN
jgi:hypothetical protein